MACEVQACTAHTLRQFKGLLDSPGPDGIRLEYLEASLLHHGGQLQHAADLGFTAGNRDLGKGAEFGQLIEPLHEQRLFDPEQICVMGCLGKTLGPRQIPLGCGAVTCVPGGLVAVHGEPHLSFQGLGRFLYVPSVHRFVEVVHPQLHGFKALLEVLVGKRDALRRLANLTCGHIQTDVLRPATQQFIHRFLGQLALDVPKGRFDPKITQPSVSRNAEHFQHMVYVGGIFP